MPNIPIAQLASNVHSNGRISLRMLRYFQVLADELHFGRAAAQLNISQPPLSTQIKELEDILEIKLLERNSRKVALTHAGRVLKTEVDRILSATETSLNYVRQIGRNENQHLNIGIIGTALWGALLPALKAFRVDYPHATWTLHELPQQRQIEQIMQHTIDIGINRNVAIQSTPNISYQHISRESVMVALLEHDPLCQFENLDLMQLAERPFISLSFSHSDFAQQLYDYCVQAGFYPLIAQQAMEPQTVLALVSAGLGIALLPETCSLIHWPGVKFMPLNQQIPADLYALYLREHQSPIAHAFLQAIGKMTE
ncbi:LysR family transcriptional regulator [Hafnia sp.]